MTRFAAFIGTKPVTQDRILTFLEKQEAKGVCRNSLRTYRDVLRANLSEWPFERPLSIAVDEIDVSQPTLSVDQLCTIKAWAEGVDDAQGLAFLAISSVFGLRRAELADLSERSFYEKRKYMKVHTRKGGTKRVHIVPEAIRPVLARHRFKTISATACGAVIRRMLINSGIDAPSRCGWHAIRRAVNTGLLRTKALDLIEVASFMRWKIGRKFEELRMVSRYDKRTWQEIDEAVFVVHPFLDLWR
jgi:hypothetical protein